MAHLTINTRGRPELEFNQIHIHLKNDEGTKRKKTVRLGRFQTIAQSVSIKHQTDSTGCWLVMQSSIPFSFLRDRRRTEKPIIIITKEARNALDSVKL